MKDNIFTKILIGSSEYRQAEQEYQRQKLLIGENPYRIRVGGIVGLIQKLSERKRSQESRGGGAGSNKT